MPKHLFHQSLEASCLAAMRFALGREVEDATSYDKYQCLAIAIRTYLMDRWLETKKRYDEVDAKKVYYLSLEFLMGRALQNAVLNLDMEPNARKAIHDLGMVLEDVYEQEFDAGLGNGGLGRLAACFLDSMATMAIPAKGYGIRYEYGIFNQEIENGQQVEKPDHWLFRGNPWETPRMGRLQTVRFYGRTLSHRDEQGHYRVEWVDTEDVFAVPYETPVPGYHNDTVNLLTLWAVKAGERFNLGYFNDGDYLKAVEQQEADETISKVLYPGDSTAVGKELRLKQQYFFASASLQEILQEFLKDHDDLALFPQKVAIQLNDTHPSIAIPELMRLLMDVHQQSWENAWNITTNTFAYTNHTLLPEALEVWDVGLLEHLLPRHLEILYEINHRFLEMVAKTVPEDVDLLRRLSIFEENGRKRVRMAHLAVVGSHSVNGVAALHTQLLKDSLMSDFNGLWPQKFNNKTNGITQRRWLKQANPALSRLITETIGEKWLTDLEAMRELVPYAKDESFKEAWRSAKEVNKLVLADYIRRELGILVDPDSMFDVQVKRIHEYKRQLLNILGVVARYFRIKDEPDREFVPRTVLLGGKAAPEYFMAKLIIRLANDIARVINNDPGVEDRLKLIFLPNYRVSLAERIFPASNLSEQISTAGKEASGTGNMKFALNGALTIGTLDGANVEIKDAVGDDNIFIFGLNAWEVAERKAAGYNPWEPYGKSYELRRVLERIGSGFFSPDDRDRYRSIVDSLLQGGDEYLVLADFDAYMACQEKVDECYSRPFGWAEKSIMNVARIGYFSSDRTINEYAKEIWNVSPIP